MMPSGKRTSIGLLAAALLLALWSEAGAQTTDADKPEAASPNARKPAPPPPLSAPAAVREGNRRLLAGSPDAALEAYRHAEVLAPEAREIAFVEGLAQYDMKAFDEARRSFERAAGSHDDALADDALYSLATCDHAEAFEKSDSPKDALGLLESAMKRYRDVLDHRPDHAAARDANFKAASMWRQLKQLMEQQQQQQQQQSDENDEQEQSDEEQQQGDQQQQDEQEQQQPSEQESQEQSQEEQEEQQTQQAQEGDEQQKQESASTQQHEDQQQQDEQEQQDQAQPKPDEKEQISREQAERKLREMMQALRDREKARPRQVERLPARPVEKDW